MTSVEFLYGAIFSDPATIALRHVLADFLLELGDPRGEFIALQLRPRRCAKEKRLLLEHRKQWLGRLADDLNASHEKWTRGFPTEAKARLLRSSAGDPRWNTLEILDVGIGNEPQVALGEPTFHALKRLSGVRRDGLNALLDAPQKPALDALEFLGPGDDKKWNADDLALTLKLTAFPKLRHLRLYPQLWPLEAHHLDWLWGSALIRQLTSLHLEIRHSLDCLPACLVAAQPLTGLQLLTLGGAYAAFEFSRGRDGRFSRLHVRHSGVTNNAKYLAQIVRPLNALPEDALIEFQYTGKRHPAAKMKPMKKAVARQRRLKKQKWLPLPPGGEGWGEG